MASKLKMSDGDWVCADEKCGNVNFARRSSCNRCGREKIGVDTIKQSGIALGKQAASKSGGLFSAEDWVCSKCKNVNWARRNTCNMCNNPKFSKVEARTGYGGGYNERQNVEYNPKYDTDDDEYDEFGRRKKKRKTQNITEHQNITANQVEQKSEEIEKKEEIDNEEEDDDEDGDLSKYMLDDDEDDDDEDVDLSKYALDDSGNEEEPPKKKGRSSSRSSSRSRSRSPKKRRHSSSSSSSSSSRSRSRSSRSSSSRSSSRSPRHRRRSSSKERSSR